jgi:hypothetical protein
VSRDTDLYLEELWVSLFSLRKHNQAVKTIVLVDAPTSERIKQNKELASLITELKVVNVPEEYSPKDRSREIKTSIRNLIDGDFLFIDTDTVICAPLDDVDLLHVQNIAMVPELHGPFKEHLTYGFVSEDTKRIFNVDVSDSPYWFNSGCMLVRDNDFTREFFQKWNENWKYSAFKKNNSTDQRALLKTDHDYGYIIECLPDMYNCQMAMSIKYFYDAKIVHFWHMRKNFTPVMDFSPFMSHEIYKKLRESSAITEELSKIILNCKAAFNVDTMICGKNEIELIFSPFHTVLWASYKKGGFVHWLLDKTIHLIQIKNRILNRLK